MKSTALRMIVGVTCLSGPACARRETPPPPPTEVLVVPVVQQDVPVEGEWIGTLEGSVNADIRPKVEGYLLRQPYKEGQAQQQLFPAELTLARTRRDQRVAVVNLYRALGGGWPAAAPVPDAP